MKKAISIFLCLAMILSVVPMYASAAAANEHDELIASASKAFPEYAELLNNPPMVAATRSANTEDKVVFRETRDISKDKKITLDVYESGKAMIMESQLFPVEVTESYGSEEGFDYLGTISYRVTCNGANGVFSLNGVKYKIFRGKSGSFTSYGTASTDSACAIGTKNLSSTSMTFPLTFNWGSASRIGTSFIVNFAGARVQAYTMD